MKYFFHVKNGLSALGDSGLELDGLEAVKEEAIGVAADLLKSPLGKDFWAGDPWRLWVTDEPRGAGKTIVSLTLSAGT